MIRISERPLSIDRTKSGARRAIAVGFLKNRTADRAPRVSRGTHVRTETIRLSVVIALGRKTSPSGLRSDSEPEGHGADTIQEIESVPPILQAKLIPNALPSFNKSFDFSILKNPKKLSASSVFFIKKRTTDGCVGYDFFKEHLISFYYGVYIERVSRHVWDYVASYREER